MSRPCHCDRLPPKDQPYTTAYCRLCYLWHTDPRYQALWGPDVPPSLGKRLWHFLKALALHSKRFLPRATARQVAKRQGICQACPYFDNGLCTHRTCGCQVARKIQWADQECPLGKW